MTDDWQTHESYGMASFHRINGDRDHLFGCGVKCNNTIRLEINSGAVQRHLSEKWYRAGDNICYVEFSPAQFVELLTSMNCGSGVPCTILQVKDKRMERCPKQDDLEKEKEDFRADIKGTFKETFELLESLQCKIYDSKLTKKEREELGRKLQHIETHLKDNIPFVYDQFVMSIDMVQRQIIVDWDAEF